jgi:hypothetical protein
MKDNDRAKHYWESIRYYRRTEPSRRPVVLAGFLQIAARLEKDPELKERLIDFIEQEKKKLNLDEHFVRLEKGARILEESMTDGAPEGDRDAVIPLVDQRSERSTDGEPAKRRGIRLWCPECRDITSCHAVRPEQFGLPSARRFEGSKYKDVQWFRRVRSCDDEQHQFVTGELSEDLIFELMQLRDRVAAMQRPKIERAMRRHKWLSRNETIPRELAEIFVRKTAWWLTHSSGAPVRAPRHVDRMYKSDRHGWALDFGANTFLVGKALERCRAEIRRVLDVIRQGDVPIRSDVERRLKQAIARSVANYDGDEYRQYQIADEQLIFGAQAISLTDGARFVLEDTGIAEFLAPA